MSDIGRNLPLENAMKHIAALEAALAVAQRERDLAIAHDRQPYPTAFAYEQVCKVLAKVKEERDALRAQLETERMRLAACGVAALANTPESAATTRINKDNPYWSASYGDVCNAVDREIALRTHRAKCVEALKKAKRNHLVEEDCWYNCPASGQCCRPNCGTACNCGADEVNNMIDITLDAQEEK